MYSTVHYLYNIHILHVNGLMQYISVTHIPCLQPKLREKHLDRFEQGLCAVTYNMWVLPIISNGQGKPHPIVPHIARSTRWCCWGPDHTTPKLRTGWNSTISQNGCVTLVSKFYFLLFHAICAVIYIYYGISLLYPSSTFRPVIIIQ